MKCPDIPIIDIHAHILPGVDDGCRSMKEAVKMLVRSYKQGVRAVVATPHDLGGDNPFDYERILDDLRKRINKILPGFKLYLGQETYYKSDLINRLNNGEAYTLGGGRYVLVEFSPGESYSTVFKGLRDISACGYVPVLAHVERYACLRKNKSLKEILEVGCCLQMNFSSLQGSFFNKNVRWCRRQVKAGVIYVLGTDMHRLDFRPPEISGAIKWLAKNFEKAYIKELVYDNALKMLNQ